MLKSAGDEENSKAIDSFLSSLASAKGTRDELKATLAAMAGDKSPTVIPSLQPFIDEMSKLPVTAKALAVDAAADLSQTLRDVPGSSLASDWSYLSNEMRRDLAQSPEKTLADLENVRRRIVNSHNTRMFYIGSMAVKQKLEPIYKSVLAGFDKSDFVKEKYNNERLIDARAAG